MNFAVGKRFFGSNEPQNDAERLGYRNKRITNAVIDQMQTMPQMTPKFLQPYKSLLAEKMEKLIEARFHTKGRIHFNAGGAQAAENAVKIVRNLKHLSQSPF